MTPLVDAEADYTFEKIAEADGFKTPYFLSTYDIQEGVEKTLRAKTLDEWTEKWNEQASLWFLPFPNSTCGLMEWAGRNILNIWARMQDASTDLLFKLFGIGGDASEEEVNEKVDDIFDFEGWWEEDGVTLSEDAMDDLASFYGVPDDDYALGVEAWLDFEVKFPTGSTRRDLSEDEMKSLMEQIEERYAISDAQRAVLEEAMERVGAYWYSLTWRAHMNGIEHTSGPSECSGFVSGVFHRALNIDINHSAAEYATLGSPIGSYMDVQPGHAIAHANGGRNYSGHVAIFLGYLEEGVPGYPGGSGPGYYCIECTSSKSSGVSGSILKKYDPSKIQKYSGEFWP